MPDVDIILDDASSDQASVQDPVLLLAEGARLLGSLSPGDVVWCEGDRFVAALRASEEPGTATMVSDTPKVKGISVIDLRPFQESPTPMLRFIVRRGDMEAVGSRELRLTRLIINGKDYILPQSG